MDGSHVWTSGDACRVKWSGDGDVYDATIKKVIRAKDSFKLKFLVHFSGFTSEDDEEVEIDQLELPAGRKRLHKVELELEDLELPPRKQEVTVVRTSQVQLKEASSKTSSRSEEQDRLRAPSTLEESLPKRPKNFSLYLSDSDDDSKKDEAKSFLPSGFDDDDLEKPKFTHKANCPKYRLVLSGSGVDKEIAIPATINQYLYEYQREGVRFLYKHYKDNVGAILGDDMGLGKTVQVIAFLSALLGKSGTKSDVLKLQPKFIRKLSEDYTSDDEESERKTYLIIGPASVLYNWVEEFETWGHFTIGKFHKTYKQQTIADMEKGKLDIVITTYETCRDHVKQLNRYNWDAVIADEAHKIKGMKAEITQALKSLKCRRRYGLTGTALQNHMKELWCIFDWANPGCLGTVHQFEENFEKVMVLGQKQDATKRQLADARKAKEKFANLKSKWFLRRTKDLISDQLPKKSEQVVYCRPTDFQLDVYKGILGHPDIQLILRQNDPCPCKSGRKRGKCHYKKSEDGRTVNQLVFSYLHLLMKTANHVALLMPERTRNENQRKQAQDICEIAFAKHSSFREQTRQAAFRTLSDPKYCGKMKVLAGLLKVFKKENCKVLLFSLSTQLLDIIEQYVISTGYEYRRLDGTTADVRRVRLVHEFNRNPNIFLFLSSTKAGGVGLNLTGANVVIIYDPNWNPTHDLQAQDRAYRLGQGRDVRVYRLITMGTIEENIYLRQVFKQQLDRITVGEENAKRLFYENDIKGLANMFKLRSSDSCLTMDILERNQKIETNIRGFTIGRYIPPVPKTSLLDDVKEEDEISDDEDVDNDDEYGCDAVVDSDLSDFDEQESESSRESPANLKQHRTTMTSSSSLFSNSSPYTSPSTSHKSGSNRTKERPQASKAKRNAQGAVPKGEETHVQISSDEEPVRYQRQDSTSATSASVSCVSDVFERCAVPHMHENKKLIGASKAEDHMSRCAIQDVYELHQYSQVPAAFCDPCSESGGESDDIGRAVSPVPTRKEPKPAPSPSPFQNKAKGGFSMVINGKNILVGQTPVAVRRKQLLEMADFAKCDVKTFAKTVMDWTEDEMQTFLQRFYTNMDKDLRPLFEDTDGDGDPVTSGKNKNITRHSKGDKKTPKAKKSIKPKFKAQGCRYQSASDSSDESLPVPWTSSKKQRKKTTDHCISSDSDSDVGNDRNQPSTSNQLIKHGNHATSPTTMGVDNTPKVSPRSESFRVEDKDFNDFLDDILGDSKPKVKDAPSRQKQRSIPKQAAAGKADEYRSTLMDEILGESPVKKSPKKSQKQRCRPKTMAYSPKQEHSSIHGPNLTAILKQGVARKDDEFTNKFIDEIMGESPVKKPPKTSTKHCRSETAAYSPKKDSPKKVNKSNDLSDKSFILDELDIFSEDIFVRKAAPKRKHVMDYSEIKSKRQSSGEKDSDLSSVNLNPSQDSLFD